MMEELLKPDVVRSKIDSTVFIEPFSHVIDSTLEQNAKVYKQCWVVKSTMHENTFIGDGTKIDNSILAEFSRCGKYNHLYHVQLGRHTYTGQDTVIMHTKIGSFSSISWGITIGAAEHDFSKITSHSFLYNPYDKMNNNNIFYNRFEKKCEVGNDVWIGANSTILRGVVVHDGAVIGANSIVTKDVPPYAIVAGNPARIMKYRFEKDIVERLLKIKWWVLSDEIITRNCSLFANDVSHQTLDDIEKLINR